MTRVSVVVALLTCLLCVGAARDLRADQVQDDQLKPQEPTTRQYNNRLPPVIPGEEIVTETGQKMRVWSSAGPVPVNPRPTSQTYNGTLPSVIVDGRGYPGNHPGPDHPEPRE
jgi:hypothetical protein